VEPVGRPRRPSGSSARRLPPIFGLDIAKAIGLSESLSGEDGQKVPDLLLTGERVGEGQVDV
jgi:hypothetical protein